MKQAQEERAGTEVKAVHSPHTTSERSLTCLLLATIDPGSHKP